MSWLLRQELSEHTAAKPALLFFVKGEATVGLGDDVQEAQARIWGHMPAGFKHSIKSRTLVDIVGGLTAAVAFVTAKAIR